VPETEERTEELGTVETPDTSGTAPKITLTRTTSQERWRKVWRVLGVMSCLFFLAAGTVFGHFYWGSKTFRDLVNNHAGSSLINFVSGKDITADWVPERAFADRTSINVLILGVDKEYDHRGIVIKDAHGRSDSMMLARFDFVRGRIDALTIPRDTAVRIPGYRGVHKINAAHNFGGPDKTIETIKEVFGVEADAVASINFEGFQKIVDALGGVTVNVEKKLDYDDNWGNLHIHLKPGIQHLDGYKAMGYVRMRHSDNDEMRSKRQHEFLEALRSKIKSPATVVKLPHVIETVNDELKKHNLSVDQLLTLANFARKLPRENIRIATLPSFEGPSYVTVYEQKAAELIQELFYPNMQVALNIDTPDPNYVRELNAPYERGSGRSERRRRTRRGSSRTERPTGQALGDLRVEEPAASSDSGTSGDSGASEPAPAPEPSTGGGSGTTGGGETGGTQG
jgi:LCP family protein required for cell wall assembly